MKHLICFVALLCAMFSPLFGQWPGNSIWKAPVKKCDTCVYAGFKYDTTFRFIGYELGFDKNLDTVALTNSNGIRLDYVYKQYVPTSIFGVYHTHGYEILSEPNISSGGDDNYTKYVLWHQHVNYYRHAAALAREGKLYQISSPGKVNQVATNSACAEYYWGIIPDYTGWEANVFKFGSHVDTTANAFQTDTTFKHRALKGVVIPRSTPPASMLIAGDPRYMTKFAWLDRTDDMADAYKSVYGNTALADTLSRRYTLAVTAAFERGDAFNDLSPTESWR